ncbi:Bax inhibitor-1/YccA family protein [Massilia sp. TS11]|nr:Bax inhibitor-1/YccA family protein [Massilia sp. TS11]MCG2583132.1 Bax inhibitor-1/YccA family protein [Massilia sp. TS11]
MIPNIQQQYDIGASAQFARNRVLRNTYGLLALSMLPTILGAVVGMTLALPLIASGIGFLVLFLAMFGLIFAIEKYKNSGTGVLLLLGFTFVMGMLLAPLLTYTLHFRNGAQLIMLAFGGTAAVFATMASIATVSKRDFSSMGKWLFAGVIVLLLAGIANIFLQLPALTIVMSAVTILIFSAYILYDVQQVVNGGETNYVTATLQIYLDIYNIFTALLRLLGIVGGDD